MQPAARNVVVVAILISLNVRFGTAPFSAAAVLTSTAGMVVLLRPRNNTSEKYLTTALQAGKTQKIRRDIIIPHDEIIGNRFRECVSLPAPYLKKKLSYRILNPTLAEYTDLSDRIVTPVS